MSMLKYPDLKKAQQNEVVDIPTYAPNQNLRVRDYMLYEALSKLEENFPKFCMDFLKSAKPDAYNATYMDAVVNRIICEAIEAIRIQRADHKRGIYNLHNLHNADIRKTKEMRYSRYQC